MAQTWLRRFFQGACIGIACLILSNVVGAEDVSVELSGSGQHLINIAIPGFLAQGTASEPLEAELAPVLQNDLRISGFFDTLENEAVRIEGIHREDGSIGEIQFQQWADLGARLLVKGVYQLQGNALVLECRVYDTLGGDFILGKRYEGDMAQARTIIHRFSDEIIEKMTGQRGISSSKIIFVSNRSGGKELFQIDFDGANLTQLTRDNSLIMSPAVSPDGKKVAYTSYKENNPDLYVMDLGSKTSECVAMYPGMNFAADWAPDGNVLALTLSKDGNPELYLLDLASKNLTRLTKNKWNDVSASWSPDGRALLYTADNIGAPHLYMIDRTGSNPRRISFHGSYNVSPSWSPAGDMVAFASSMEGDFNIYTMQTNGDMLRRLTSSAGRNEDPAWSPDGRYLAFQSTRDGTNSIYIMNADGSNQRQLTDNKGLDISPAWVR